MLVEVTAIVKITITKELHNHIVPTIHSTFINFATYFQNVLLIEITDFKIHQN